MPYLHYPKSDVRRLEFLKTCVVTARGDIAKGNLYLPETLVAQINEELTNFSGISENTEARLSARNKEIREKNEELEKLERIVRDFFEVVKRRTYRNDDPAEVLRFYNISLSGDIPSLLNEQDVLSAATKIVTGDRHASEVGFVAMQNPSAEEVNNQLQKTRSEREDVGMADREYNEVQKELQDTRIPVDALIRDVADHLQFALRKETASNTRRMMRTYGFAYRLLKGEPEEDVVEENISES